MPSPALLPAAQAAPPLCRRQRRPLESVTVHLSVFRSLVLPTRDWAELPPELISCILRKLDPVQIMLGADKVCRSWRRAARDDPEVWRRVDMRGYEVLSDRNLIDANQMAIDAVQRSRGRCQAFWGEGSSLHDGVLRCLADRAPLLKSLILVWCKDLSDQGFMQAVKSMPLLEDLQLSYCSQLQRRRVFEVVAKECPRLKHLINRHVCLYSYLDRSTRIIADGEAMAVAKMRGLRSLQLIHNDLTNQGLAAILDKCVHLESLCLHYCWFTRMTRKIKARMKKKRILVNYMRYGEDFEPGSPNSVKKKPGSLRSECSTCREYFDNERDKERHRKRYVNDREAMVISTVCKLRSLQLYRNDLTSKGLAAILDRCPHLEFQDVWNCLNIVRDSALQAKCGWIRTNKLTTKLLADCSNNRIFNPKCLDIHNCRDIILNMGRNVFVDNTPGAKHNRFILKKRTRNYYRKTKKMMNRIKNYMADMHIGTIDYMEFDGAEFDYYMVFRPKKFRHFYSYSRDYYGKPDHEKFEPCCPTIECSTCLMFEYFAERWGVLDLDNYTDYHDPSYDLDGHDETNCGMDDKMVGKRLRRYLKME